MKHLQFIRKLYNLKDIKLLFNLFIKLIFNSFLFNTIQLQVFKKTELKTKNILDQFKFFLNNLSLFAILFNAMLTVFAIWRFSERKSLVFYKGKNF